MLFGPTNIVDSMPEQVVGNEPSKWCWHTCLLSCLSPGKQVSSSTVVFPLGWPSWLGQVSPPGKELLQNFPQGFASFCVAPCAKVSPCAEAEHSLYHRAANHSYWIVQTGTDHKKCRQGMCLSDLVFRLLQSAIYHELSHFLAWLWIVKKAVYQWVTNDIRDILVKLKVFSL